MISFPNDTGPEMDFSNVEIDDDKPVSSIGVSNEETLLQCFNWKITQPLLKEDNLKKITKLNPEENGNQFRRSREFNLLNEFELLSKRDLYKLPICEL